MRLSYLGLATAFISAGLALNAAPITVGASNSGYYTSGGDHNLIETDYLTGRYGNADYRSFVAFDLSGQSGTVQTVTLSLYTPTVLTSDGLETLAIYDITTALSALLPNAFGAAGIATYNDLGSGTQFAIRDFTSVDNGTIVDIIFNASGIAAVQAALGGQFAVGAALTSISGSSNQALFVGADGRNVRNLTIDFLDQTGGGGGGGGTTETPEIATFIAMGTGLAAMVSLRRRRAQQGFTPAL